MGVKAEEIPNDMLPALKEYVLPKLRKLDSNSDTRTLQGIGSAIKRDRKHAYPVLVKVDYTVLPKLVEEDQHVWKFIARETCIVPGYENTKPRELDGRCSGPRYCDRQPNDICWLGHLNKKGIHSEELGFK